jgi:hypothetical protein
MRVNFLPVCRDWTRPEPAELRGIPLESAQSSVARSLTFLCLETTGMAFGHERDGRRWQPWLRLGIGLSALGLFIAWGAWHVRRTPPLSQE